MAKTVFLTLERETDHDAVESLLDSCFGIERHKRVSYRFRQGRDPEKRLCWLALDESTSIRASIRYWQVGIDGQDTSVLLLGPLAVEPSMRGLGLANRLMTHTLDLVARTDVSLVFLVGVPELYARWGFVSAVAHGYAMPWPFERRRFLVREIQPGAIVTATKGAALKNIVPLKR